MSHRDGGSTHDRTARSDSGGEADLAATREGHRTILAAILRQQVLDIHSGIPPSNKVDVARLSRSEKEALKGALRIAPRLDALVRDLLF